MGRCLLNISSININDITIEVHRKKMKNMSIRVCPPDGNVKISAPLRSSMISIQRFAATHIDWIEKHRSAFLAAPDAYSIIHRDKALMKTYRELMMTQLHSLVPLWEEKIGVRANHYSIRLMKSRWGTCHPGKRKICLNLALIKYPLTCLEYVIVHELVHLLEASHNARFKSLMDKFMPDWRVYKGILDGGISC